VTLASGLSLNAGLTGHLRLVCGLDARGQSSIRQQSFRAPIHLSKPHTDAGTLVVNVVNPTAGLLAGDRIECSVKVEEAARLLLTTPSASRAHCMPSGRATVHQEFRVATSASFENWPELLIPQAGARYSQVTRIDVADGGELMFWELLAPGRVASGEAFRFVELDWSTTVHHAGRCALRERYRIVPGEPSVDAWRDCYSEGYYASGILFLPGISAESPLWRAIHDLQTAGITLGVSALAGDGWTIRLLTQDSILLRKTLSEIRRLVYGTVGRPIPSVRRAGC
jgi:urease accessory protein